MPHKEIFECLGREKDYISGGGRGEGEGRGGGRERGVSFFDREMK